MENSGRDTQPSTRMRTNRQFSQLSTFDSDKQTLREKNRCVYDLLFLAYFQLPTALQYNGQSEHNIKMQIHNVL